MEPKLPVKDFSAIVLAVLTLFLAAATARGECLTAEELRESQVNRLKYLIRSGISFAFAHLFNHSCRVGPLDITPERERN